MSKDPQSRLSRTWRLFTLSLQIIAKDKKLLVFPAGIMFFHLGFVAFFVIPAGLLVSGLPWADLSSVKLIFRHIAALAPTGTALPPILLHWEFFAYLIIIYLFSMFSATFFNVAFYHEILEALAGNGVSIVRGLHFAVSRSRPILMWSLFAAVVGILIKAIQERSGWLGRVAFGLVGMGWSAASAFIIPVLIRDGSQNPIKLLKGSANTLTKTWGESLTAYLGIRFGGVFLFILGPLIVIFGLFFFLLWLHVFKLALVIKMIAAVAALWLLALIVCDFLLGVCSDIFRCALYIYASEGVLPTPYTSELMDAVWKMR